MAKQLVVNSNLLDLTDTAIILAVTQQIQPMLNDKIQQEVEQVLQTYFKKTFKLKLSFVEQLNFETPYECAIRKEQEAQQAFIKELDNNELTQALKNSFNAVLLEHTVKKINN